MTAEHDDILMALDDLANRVAHGDDSVANSVNNIARALTRNDLDYRTVVDGLYHIGDAIRLLAYAVNPKAVEEQVELGADHD